MGNYFVQLPAPQVPRNALLDLSPINNALDSVREQNNENRNALLRRETLDMQKQKFGMERESHALEMKKTGMDYESALAKRAAGFAQQMASETDPNRKAAWAKRMYSLDPSFSDNIVRAGIDPNDHDTVAKFIIAEARGYQDPNANLTNDMKEYNFAKGQGYGGTFQDYQVSLKQAGASRTNIATDMRAENAEAKARGEGLGKRFNGIADDGFEAQKDSLLIDRLGELGNNVDPGTKTAALEAIRQATGIPLDPNADNVQAFNAAINYMTPRMRVPGSGATSDFDAATFQKALPQLTGTPEGNRLIVETLGGMNRNRRAAGVIAQRWQRGEITAQQADAELQKLPDPFVSFRKASAAMKQPGARDLKTMTPEQAQRLPSGTRFMGTDGKVRVVR